MIAKVSRALPGTVGESGRSTLRDATVPSGSILLVMWRRRWVLALTIAVCLAGAVAYLVRATPIYTSSARLLVEQSGPRIMSDYPTATDRSGSYAYKQAEVLTSTPILAAAIDSLPAGRMEVFRKVDNRVAFLKKELNATVGKKDDILTLAFDAAVPQEAADVVNAVVDEYPIPSSVLQYTIDVRGDTLVRDGSTARRRWSSGTHDYHRP
jgi:uncharacterized protein involved in exopolysaccharide biosynthesis